MSTKKEIEQDKFNILLTLFNKDGKLKFIGESYSTHYGSIGGYWYLSGTNTRTIVNEAVELLLKDRLCKTKKYKGRNVLFDPTIKLEVFLTERGKKFVKLNKKYLDDNFILGSW